MRTLIDAAKRVVERWESGDLADTVRQLKAALPEDGPDDAAFISAARDAWANDDLEVDDDPVVSASDEGAWVSAWVWVSNETAGVANDEGGAS